FIENILADREIQHLLFILSYRDNEVNATHPLLATLDIIQKSGCPTNAIELSTLSLSDINLLVSESIKEESETSISLSSIVLQKTNGNPFFVSEFLKSLYEERLLNFNSIEGHWQWDENKIKNSGITENVVELMSAKIQKLSQETQKLLHLAACIGNRFDLKTLSTINRNSETQTAFDLQEALKEGIVQPIGDAYKYISEEKYEKIEYRFLHDRVQQAAYTLIPKNEKEMVHLSIGRHLLKNTKQEEMDENIFDIANHLNTGIALIQEKKEKDQLIAINHKAAMRAKQSNAYSSSLEFFKVASNLLQDREREYWQTKYSLTFSIFKNYSESQYLASNIEDAEILFDKTLQLAKTKLDKAEIYTMRITLLIGINRFQEALEVTAEAMKLFNVPIIANPNQIRVLREVAATKINIRRYLNNSDPNSILNLPELTNKEIKVIMRILMESCPAGYLYFPNALVVNALRMLNYSLKYGKSELTSYACGVMGIVSVGALHEYNDGVEFGEVSLKLNDEYKFMPCWGKVKFMFSLMQGAWRESLKDRLIPLLDEAYYSCQEAGDNLYGSYITMFGIYVKVYSSTVNLRVIYEEHIKYSTFIEQVKDEGLFLVYKLLIHMLLCFTLDSDESRKLDFQMESLTNVLQETNYTTGFNYQYLVNLQINYYHENYQEAIRYGFLAESTKDANLGQITNAGIPFYLSLAISSHYHKDLPFLSKVKYKSYMRKTIAKYKKWLANSQENFASKYYILLAEYTKVCDKNPTDLYERAIEESYKNDALGDTALANELAAKYHLSLNRSEIAKSYLLNARHYYHKWGAIVKIKQIDEKYPDLVKGVLAKVATGTDVIHDEERGTVSITTSTSGTRTQKKSTSTKMFDFNSVFKASQSLSREIQFQKLLEKLMQFLLENAGATKGFLLFNDNGTLKMEASGELKDKSIQVLQATPLKQAQGLSTSIVNYVMRTKENVVLLNAAGEGSYVNDPYIKQNKVQSLLCAPILNKGELSGIIYLENDLTTGAFTKDRIEILQILASQAAISIDNARLYDNLEGRVKQRTKEIGDIMNNVEQGIFTINEDLTINPEYSKKVIQIFARNDFGNKHFTAIFPQEIRSKLEMFLRQLFQNKFMSEKMFQSINPLKNYLLQLEKLNS
ncbi:MAG: GAF domain-containing protein, partial [Spirochaetota bacterium]